MEAKKRNSSLELLRIICMFFIIFHHYVIHGNFSFQSNSPLIWNELFLKNIALFGKLACNVFIIITGYFLICSNTNFKKIIKLIIKMFFYNFFIVIFVYTTKIINISKIEFIQQCVPILGGSWFIINYIILYCITPFLNIFLNKLEQKNYMKLIIILFILWSIIPTFSNNSWKFSNIDGFIVMYIIGGYIRRFSEKSEKKENNRNLIFSLLLMIFILISNTFLTFLGHALNIQLLVTYSNYFSTIYSIPVVLASIYIFKYYKNLNFYNKFINYIATSMLGVYLIHDNSLIRKILWTKIIPNVDFQYSPYLSIHCILKCFVVFVFCIIIDKVLSKLLQMTLYKLLDKKMDISKLSLFFNKITNYAKEILR